METLSVVIIEIIICLVLAWSLGFLMAWILFNRASMAYRREIEELEENLNYSTACNRNQEKEIIQQALKLQALEKTSPRKAEKDIRKKNIKTKVSLEKSKKEPKGVNSRIVLDKKRTKKEIDMLKTIEENLYSLK